jgi:ABC-type transport system involved in multi-copper enzyme maturation permease subunit
MNFGRVLVVATNVFREVIRDRVLYLIGLFAGVLLLSSVLLPEVAANNQNKMLVDVGLAAISVAGLIVAIFVGTGLINKEIEKRTVFVLAAKPLTPSEFVLGKHIGLSMVLTVMVGAMAAIYMGLLTVQQIPFPMESIAIATAFMILELMVIVAVALLFGVFTSSLLATILTFAVYLVGHLSRDLIVLTNLSDNPRLERMFEITYMVLPDLSRLDFKNEAVYGMELLPKPLELAGDAAYGVLYMVLLLAIATIIFMRREF